MAPIANAAVRITKITARAITAQVLQLGAAVVTAFQVCRLVAVLLLAEPVYRWWVGRG